MKKIANVVNALLPQGPMNAFAVGVVNFKTQSFEAIQANTFEDEVQFSDKHDIYFDLASVTKPLVNSLSYFLKTESFDESMKLCLNHRGGLPAWGLLARDSWKETILSYPVKESETLYSDFSALRVMLELEKKAIKQKEVCKTIWDKETVFWTDLPYGAKLVQYGHKNQVPNFGAVHDPNAWTIHDFCSHAGLFSTIDGVCRTLLKYEKETSFLAKVKKDLESHSHRFACGWDRVVNPQETLAGRGCGKFTFGHLGFTGTSIWIDPENSIGHVILSNTVKEHWYDKANLNDMRRAIGELVWSGSY